MGKKRKSFEINYRGEKRYSDSHRSPALKGIILGTIKGINILTLFLY